MKSRIGILVLGILLMLSTSFAMSVTKHDGYNVNIVNEDGVEITSADAEWNNNSRILTISGTFNIQNSLGSVQIGYSANGSPNLTTSIAFGKGNKTLNLWTNLGGVDKVYNVQSVHAGKTLKDTHHVNFIADEGNITEDFKVEISCPYEKLDEAYVWVGDTSAIIKVTATTGNILFENDWIDLRYKDNTGAYDIFRDTT